MWKQTMQTGKAAAVLPLLSVLPVSLSPCENSGRDRSEHLADREAPFGKSLLVSLSPCEISL